MINFSGADIQFVPKGTQSKGNLRREKNFSVFSQGKKKDLSVIYKPRANNNLNGLLVFKLKYS